MKNSIRKYKIENAGLFVSLTEGDLNELFVLEPDFIQLPAILFQQQNTLEEDDEIVLTHSELKTILNKTLYNSIN